MKSVRSSMPQVFTILTSLYIYFVSSLQENKSFLLRNLSVVLDISVPVGVNHESYILIRVI